MYGAATLHPDETLGSVFIGYDFVKPTEPIMNPSIGVQNRECL